MLVVGVAEEQLQLLGAVGLSGADDVDRLLNLLSTRVIGDCGGTGGSFNAIQSGGHFEQLRPRIEENLIEDLGGGLWSWHESDSCQIGSGE